LVLDNSTDDTEERVSFFFHDIGSLVEKFFEGLIELLQYQFSLLINIIQEVYYVSILLDHALSGWCFTSSRLVWDLCIIFSFSLVQLMEC
jgi:hypothetical protein